MLLNKNNPAIWLNESTWYQNLGIWFLLIQQVYAGNKYNLRTFNLVYSKQKIMVAMLKIYKSHTFLVMLKTFTKKLEKQEFLAKVSLPPF